MNFISKQWVLTILGYSVNHSLNELASLKSMSQNSFWKKQIDKRDSILEYHLNNNMWYKNFFEKNGEEGWDKVPVISKYNLQDYSKRAISKKQLFRSNYFANTSGSSGQPFNFMKDKKCHGMAWAKIFDSYEDLGITRYDKEARFFGHVKDSFNVKLAEIIKDIVFNRFRFDVFDNSKISFLNYYDKFKNNDFDYIYGYTNVILNFSKFILEESLPCLKLISPKLKLCIVTAEMCTDEDKYIIEKGLGVPLYKEYGSSETSIIALENRELKWAINTDRLWVEVLDQKNRAVKFGEVGRIVVTDLYNKCFPFIRYDLGDLGAIEQGNGYPFLFLKKIQGRESDQIYLPSGKTSPGLTFYYIVRSILKNNNNIREFRIVQRKIDAFRFIIVSKKTLSKIEKNEIEEATKTYLEPGLNLEFEICNKMREKYSGKMQQFFSEI